MSLHHVQYVNQKSDYDDDEPNAHGELLFPRLKVTYNVHRPLVSPSSSEVSTILNNIS